MYTYIAIKNTKGTYTSIIYGGNGRPAIVGPTLLKHYATRKAVYTLMKLGCLLNLGDIPEEPEYLKTIQHIYNNRREDKSLGKALDYLYKKYCVICKTKDGKLRQPQHFTSMSEMTDPYASAGVDVYVWENRHWNHYDENGLTGPLEKAVETDMKADDLPKWVLERPIAD